MSAQHTPGPWEAQRDPSHYDTLSSVVGGCSGGGKGLPHQLMASVGGFANVREQEANARLIAAAPDLLVLVAAAIERVEANDFDKRMCCDGHMCGCQASSKADEFLHYARAAIAKATAL